MRGTVMWALYDDRWTEDDDGTACCYLLTDNKREAVAKQRSGDLGGTVLVRYRVAEGNELINGICIKRWMA